MTSNLRQRIADDLGWSVEETQQFSLRALRDIVTSQKLKAYLNELIQKNFRTF